MPSFTYNALDRTGSEISGQLAAPDERRAAAHLRTQGLFPVDIIPEKEGATPSPKASRHFSMLHRFVVFNRPFIRPVKPRELSVFTRQISTMLRAGMPLLRALEVLGRQEKNQAFRRVLDSLAASIRSGDTLSGAMMSHPRVFDRLYVNMIKGGEAGGALDGVLDRLARFQEKSLHLRGKVTAALVYPVIVLSVAVAILTGLLVFVVPKFQQIFADLLKGAPLPPLTQAVLTASDAVRQHALLTFGLSLMGWLAFRFYRQTVSGANLLGLLMVKLPLFGDLLLKVIVARFGRTLGTLLSCGVPILPALLITRDTCGNARVAGAITGVHDCVKAGSTFARPLEATTVFPPMVTGLIDVGEHTGRLPEMLGKVADIYEDEVDHAVAGLSSLIEPVLILFLAVVVGTIVIALFLPIIRIVQLLT